MSHEWAAVQAAQVGDLLNGVHNHCDLAVVVEAMRLDLLNHPGEWENHTLERYLDGLSALAGSLHNLYSNRGKTLPDQPTWQMIAELLVAASGYE